MIFAVVGLCLKTAILQQTISKRWYSFDCDTGRTEDGVSRQRKLIGVLVYTGCHRRKGPNFGRVFLMLNYTDTTQNTYIQSWTVTEIMAREKCGHLAFPHSVRLQLSTALTVREECVTYFFDGTSSAQRDKIAFHYCRYVQCLVTLRKTVIWLRVFL